MIGCLLFLKSYDELYKRPWLLLEKPSKQTDTALLTSGLDCFIIKTKQRLRIRKGDKPDGESSTPPIT